MSSASWFFLVRLLHLFYFVPLITYSFLCFFLGCSPTFSHGQPPARLLSQMLFVQSLLRSSSSSPFIYIIWDVPPSSRGPHTIFKLSSAPSLESAIVRSSGPLHRSSKLCSLEYLPSQSPLTPSEVSVKSNHAHALISLKDATILSGCLKKV